jgi:integrase
MAKRRSFGAVRRLPSGRWQASYAGPDRRRHAAPVTFGTKADADGWLAVRQSEMVRGAWLPPAPPKAAPATLAAYSTAWLAGRDLSPATRQLYRLTLANQILPAFGDVPVTAITPVMVRDWHAGLAARTGPTQRAHAYSLLRTILGTAVTDDIIPANPCRVRGAGSSRRAKPIEPASIAEVQAIADGMPPRYRAMVLLAAWCGLRFGELAALTRADINVKAGKVHVRRAVSRSAGGYAIKEPKTAAGRRTVAIPPHILPDLKAHLRDHVAVAPAALVFPSEGDRDRPVHPASFRGPYDRAVAAVGLPPRTFHSLRHTGAVLAAATGATLAELMGRLGHSSPQVAMMYQHAAADRDQVIAAALSELAGGTVTPIRRAQ